MKISLNLSYPITRIICRHNRNSDYLCELRQDILNFLGCITYWTHTNIHWKECKLLLCFKSTGLLPYLFAWSSPYQTTFTHFEVGMFVNTLTYYILKQCNIHKQISDFAGGQRPRCASSRPSEHERPQSPLTTTPCSPADKVETPQSPAKHSTSVKLPSEKQIALVGSLRGS